MNYGQFDDHARAYVITQPTPPRPWINYLGNRRLTAFISQNAGGLLWYREPQHRRISRYHYTAAPGDRPGFYVYLKNRRSGTIWNPHFAPTTTPLDAFECRHEPGLTTFRAEKEAVRAELSFSIPPGPDVMLWQLSLTNNGREPVELLAASYLEFGLLEFMREIIAWTYLKSHCAFAYDAATRSIRYDYHVFEAPFTPRMAFACDFEPTGFECSREAFIGRTGSLERPAALVAGRLSRSELPLGGHGCGALARELALAPGETAALGWRFALGETWDAVNAALAAPVTLEATRAFWRERLERLQARTGDPMVDRFVNTWTPYNNLITLELARTISTDHMGLDGLRYRDTTQDALGVASLDPAFAAEQMRLIFATQKTDGGGCFSFYPHAPKRDIRDEPHRSDNTVWQVATMQNLVAETGDLGLLREAIPFRDGGSASVYDHLLIGLKHIEQRRGPRGLPTLFHADWNDGLALFGDAQAESVMLGMQLVWACRDLAGLAERLGRDADARWCRDVAAEQTRILNSDLVWDGAWYRRLLLSNGKHLGGRVCRQGSLYLNPQSWSVIAGVGDAAGRGRRAMDAVAAQLDSDCGLAILAPPYKGIPEPEDPPLGSSPGTNENGSIFCHANTWAIIAEVLLGNAARAWKYYRQQIPEALSARVGAAHYGREPYVYASTVVSRVNDRFGEGGISWLTGTASWMYIAVTQYLLGIQPTLDGLVVRPCLPPDIRRVTVDRQFRGRTHRIEIVNEGTGAPLVTIDGERRDRLVDQAR